jgi:hypothetical protein
LEDRLGEWLEEEGLGGKVEDMLKELEEGA